MTAGSRGRKLLLVIVAVLVVSAACGAHARAAVATPAWRLIAVTGPTNLPPFTSEVQELLVDAESGTFTLEFEGQETSPIVFDTAPGGIEAALEALPSIGSGNVEVTGGPGDASATSPYFVRFAGALAAADLPLLGADSSGLAGAGHTAGISPKTEGGSPGKGTLAAYATNVGGETSSGHIIVEVGPLPAGITTSGGEVGEGWDCVPVGGGQATLECETEAVVPSGQTALPLLLPLEVGAQAPALSAVALAIRGGGAGGIAEGLYRYHLPLTVSSRPAAPGVAAFWAGAFDADGLPSTQAGGHPGLAGTGFLVNTVISPSGTVIPAGDLRTVNVDLPPGFIGNPLVTPRCPQNALLPGRGELCTTDSSVGIVRAPIGVFGGALGEGGHGGLINDQPPFGYPAELSFELMLAPVSTLASIRSDSDYGVSLEAREIVMAQYVYGSFISLFGTPPGSSGRSFLTNPTDCAEQARQAPETTVAVNSWQDQDPSAVDNEMSVAIPPVIGCERLGARFHPTFSFRPESDRAASVSPFTAALHLPPEGLEEPEGLAAPELKKTVVTLPPGVDVNPSSANGLAACSEAQIGLVTTAGAVPNPIRFDRSTPDCPDASKLGIVEARSPVLEETLGGTIYLAAQEENPFDSLLGLYLVVESPRNGVMVKLPGELRPDPRTGQLTATFDYNPQLPVEDLTLRVRGGGARSPLSTPAVCGTYTTKAELTPWSAPESGPAAQSEDSFAITGAPDGGGCPTSEAGLPFAPSFDAGTTSTAAGTHSTLVVNLSRRDGEKELTRLDFTLPPGLTAKLAGVPYCPDAAIAAAVNRTGRSEQADPSCPAASRIGSVDTAAGVGSEPIHVGGAVYLAGPYGGAPLSAVVITPAVAGPFDLGDVVVRTPLFVNPETAQITARSDEIPRILRGIPLKLRSVEIKVDRQDFSLNPTSCDPMAIDARVSSPDGAVASPSSRFQVSGCQALPFKPRLKLRVIGKTDRNAKPRLKAVLTARPGEAGVRRAQVNLPRSEFLEQSHIRTVCTRVQFAAGDGNGSACPKGSIYGRAKAWTPLLDHPLEGNVYLRSNGGERKLPDLVAALDGQIDIALRGKVDSGPNKGIRNTFEVVPDAPVSRFVLEMAGGKRGLLVNSEDLCSKRAKRRAIIRLTGQNGKVETLKPRVHNQCGKSRTRKSMGR